jgi:hypothetical protein
MLPQGVETGHFPLVEFKKLVYDSKFTKCAEGVSFVNYNEEGTDVAPPAVESAEPRLQRPGILHLTKTPRNDFGYLQSALLLGRSAPR